MVVSPSVASPQFHSTLCVIHLGKYGYSRALAQHAVMMCMAVSMRTWWTGTQHGEILPASYHHCVPSWSRGRTLWMPKNMPHADDTWGFLEMGENNCAAMLVTAASYWAPPPPLLILSRLVWIRPHLTHLCGHSCTWTEKHSGLLGTECLIPYPPPSDPGQVW